MIELKHCPRCHAACKEVGEMVVAGESFPVVECPRCIAQKELFGRQFETEILYLVLRDGSLVEAEELNAHESTDSEDSVIEEDDFMTDEESDYVDDLFGG